MSHPESAAPPPLALRGVVKRHRSFQLGPVDLEVPPGSVTALVGPNGAGKTTLIRIIMGLAAPSEGSVRLFGRVPDPDDISTKAAIGFVPEEPFLYPEMTAQWHGRYAGAHFPTWDEALYRELLHRLGVPPQRQVKELSKGSRVKAELALALAHRPRLLVLDEPTSGLDPLVRGEVLQELARTAAGGKAGVLFSTHITEDVDRIADRVVFLVSGKVRLAEERERLRECWQELWLDVRGQAPDAWAAALDPEVVLDVEPAGAGYVRLIARDADAVLQKLQGRTPASLVRQRPLRLDEILGWLAGPDRGATKVGRAA